MVGGIEMIHERGDWQLVRDWNRQAYFVRHLVDGVWRDWFRMENVAGRFDAVDRFRMFG